MRTLPFIWKRSRNSHVTLAGSLADPSLSISLNSNALTRTNRRQSVSSMVRVDGLVTQCAILRHRWHVRPLWCLRIGRVDDWSRIRIAPPLPRSRTRIGCAQLLLSSSSSSVCVRAQARATLDGQGSKAECIFADGGPCWLRCIPRRRKPFAVPPVADSNIPASSPTHPSFLSHSPSRRRSTRQHKVTNVGTRRRQNTCIVRDAMLLIFLRAVHWESPLVPKDTHQQPTGRPFTICSASFEFVPTRRRHSRHGQCKERQGL